MENESIKVWEGIAGDVDAGWLDYSDAEKMSYNEACDYLGAPFNDPDYQYDCEVEEKLLMNA